MKMTLQEMRDEVPELLEYLEDNAPDEVFEEWEIRAKKLSSDEEIKQFLIEAKLLLEEYEVFEFCDTQDDYPL